MTTDPKKLNHEDEVFEEDRPTAMFSREAHGWFSSMGESKEDDASSIADLARSGVVESSPLSKSGPLPTAPASVAAPLTSRHPASTPRVTVAPALSLSSLTPKQVLVLAFVGGVVVAAVLGAAVFFILTPR